MHGHLNVKYMKCVEDIVWAEQFQTNGIKTFKALMLP